MIKLRFVTSGGPAHPSVNSSGLPPLPAPPGLLSTASAAGGRRESGYSDGTGMGRDRPMGSGFAVLSDTSSSTGPCVKLTAEEARGWVCGFQLRACRALQILLRQLRARGQKVPVAQRAPSHPVLPVATHELTFSKHCLSSQRCWHSTEHRLTPNRTVAGRVALGSIL